MRTLGVEQDGASQTVHLSSTRYWKLWWGPRGPSETKGANRQSADGATPGAFHVCRSTSAGTPQYPAGLV
eukprot:701273-Pyramimonas_sp.AAC.1